MYRLCHVNKKFFSQCNLQDQSFYVKGPRVSGSHPVLVSFQSHVERQEILNLFLANKNSANKGNLVTMIDCF